MSRGGHFDDPLYRLAQLGCIGDSAAMSLDFVVYATASGNAQELDRTLERAYLEGTSPLGVLRANYAGKFVRGKTAVNAKEAISWPNQAISWPRQAVLQQFPLACRGTVVKQHRHPAVIDPRPEMAKMPITDPERMPYRRP